MKKLQCEKDLPSGKNSLQGENIMLADNKYNPRFHVPQRASVHSGEVCTNLIFCFV